MESYGFFPTLADKLLGRALCRALGLDYHPPRPARAARQPYPIDLVTGAAMFADAALFTRIGRLDEQYFYIAKKGTWRGACGRPSARWWYPRRNLCTWADAAASPGTACCANSTFRSHIFCAKTSVLSMPKSCGGCSSRSSFRARRGRQCLRLAQFLAQGASIRPATSAPE